MGNRNNRTFEMDFFSFLSDEALKFIISSEKWIEKVLTLLSKQRYKSKKYMVTGKVSVLFTIDEPFKFFKNFLKYCLKPNSKLICPYYWLTILLVICHTFKF